MTVFFHFLLQPEAKREAARAEIAKTLDDHLGRITWPEGFRLDDAPAYSLVTPEEMTAAEWIASQPVDWDFVSSAGAALRPK